MTQQPCEHDWAYQLTSKSCIDDGGYQLKWTRVDRYFCRKCLEQKDVQKTEYSRECPEWYKLTK